jgi:hypothetical protein
MSPKLTLNQLMKFSRIVALGAIVLFALVTIVGKGGGGDAPSNKTPVANTITATVDQDTPTPIDVAAQSGNSLGDTPSTVTVTSNPANGTTSVAGSVITYTPNAGYLGPDTFDYRITDNDNETATSMVNITVRETVAPTATIKFPGPMSATESKSESVIVTGTASDAGMITSVKILLGLLDVDATTTDDFANWRAAGIQLVQQGINVLNVETTDEFSNIDPVAAQLSVKLEAGPILQNTTKVVLDTTTNPARGIAYDSQRNAIVAVDLATGERTILSDSDTPDSVNPFDNQLTDLVLDPAGNRLLVAERNSPNMDDARILGVDLTTGERTIVSSNGFPDMMNLFGRAQLHLTLDTITNPARLLVSDAQKKMIFAVSLANGARMILSDNSAGTVSGALNPFLDPKSIALDFTNSPGRALVLDGSRVVAVELVNGGRLIVSDNDPGMNGGDANPFDCCPLDIAIDGPRVRALITDGFEYAVNPPPVFSPVRVLAMSLVTGDRTIFSSNTTPNTTSPFIYPDGIAVDTAGNRALVADAYSGVMSVDLGDGARAAITDKSTPDSVNPLVLAGRMALDSAGNRLLVLDRNRDAIIAVDLSTGARTILSDAATPDALNPFEDPRAIVLDSANSRALVTDFGMVPDQGLVIAVDLMTGARTILSDNNAGMNGGDANPLPSFPQDITIDSTTTPNRALVVGGGGGIGIGTPAVVTVDLATGERTTLATAFSGPIAIDLDAPNNRALVLDVPSVGGGADVVAVDLTTGMLTTLSSGTVRGGGLMPFVDPRSIVVDSAGNRALVTESARGLNGVVAVDLTTGARTIFSDNTDAVPTPANPFIDPVGIAVDRASGRVFVTDRGRAAVMVLDIDSGERMIQSH